MDIRGIKKVMITEEALQDLEKVVNNAKQDGLLNVTASYNEQASTFEFEMEYESKEQQGQTFTRSISINLENP